MPHAQESREQSYLKILPNNSRTSELPCLVFELTNMPDIVSILMTANELRSNFPDSITLLALHLLTDVQSLFDTPCALDRRYTRWNEYIRSPHDKGILTLLGCLMAVHAHPTPLPITRPVGTPLPTSNPRQRGVISGAMLYIASFFCQAKYYLLPGQLFRHVDSRSQIPLKDAIWGLTWLLVLSPAPITAVPTT